MWATALLLNDGRITGKFALKSWQVDIHDHHKDTSPKNAREGEWVIAAPARLEKCCTIATQYCCSEIAFAG
jgi:hypothetical protein